LSDTAIAADASSMIRTTQPRPRGSSASLNRWIVTSSGSSHATDVRLLTLFRHPLIVEFFAIHSISESR
jgi:hypothetical protein